MKPARHLPICILTTLLVAAAHAEPWTLDDIILRQSASDWTLSADGRLIAWSQTHFTQVEDEDRRISHLWLARRGEEPLQLTRGTDSSSSPAFSPDDKHLAFLSSRPRPKDAPPLPKEAGQQIWALSLGGGEPFPISSLGRSVRQFSWIDAETLLVAAEESPTALERERKDGADTTRVVDDVETPPVRLFRVGLDGKVRRLTTNDHWIMQMSVSPDGKQAAVIELRDLSYAFDQKVPPFTYLVDLESGAMRRLLADTSLLPSSLGWAPDSSGFYFTNEYSSHPTYRTASIRQLHFYDLAADRAEPVDLDWPRGLGGGYLPVPGGVIALLADGVRFRPSRISRAGDAWRRSDLQGAHVRHFDRWQASRDGSTLIYRSSSANRPPQWFVARLEGDRISDDRKLTQLNPGYEGKPTGKSEVLTWKGALGETVEGLLHYPLDWQEGKRYPLILDIHGGPSGTDRDTWDSSWGGPNILWRQRGAFVLQVNYHGSAGYGLDWVESIRERYYELEIPDIEAGVDLVIERGLADPDRLATSGWSNGGILSAELITRTDRYKVASVGAADVEWISDWANVDFGASFDNYYFGGPPWEIPEVYIEKSPFFRLTEVTTPTIIHTGTEDRNVPPHQSWSLYRALQQIGKTEAKLFLYPGEPHGLRKIAHQRRKAAEDLAFFDRYLFGKGSEDTWTVPESSPLHALMVRRSAARQGLALGAREEGLLVPEMVDTDELRVGRFEVTRAQLAVFGNKRAVVGENLPATVPFEAARSYVERLAEVTGRPYRLPTEEEARGLARDGGGNTLDHWVGYSPNPQDVATLRKRLEKLPGDSPLLRPVGSFQPTESGIFDLDGNVAEWAVAEDGNGVAIGPSADRPADAMGADPAGADYIGFRVVLGPVAGSD